MIQTIVTLILECLIIGALIIAYQRDKKKVTSKKDCDEISFRDSMKLTGSPIIIFENNGKNFNFLLDTGSNVSMIDSKSLQESEFVDAKLYSKNMGIEGEASMLPSVYIDLKYKNCTYNDKFLVKDFSQAFNALKQQTGVKLDGIIGTTFFTKYRYVLDFDELVAYSKKKL